MPSIKKEKGLTKNNVEAYGAIIVVYFMDRGGPIFLMGQETSFLTESGYTKSFKTSDGENIYDAFLSPGDITNAAQLEKAKEKFTKICKEIENSFQGKRLIGHVTFDEPRNSSKVGFISAKPRYVNNEKKDKMGFIKGGHKQARDTSIDETAIRECFEETSVKLDITKLVDSNIQIYPDFEKKTPYSLFQYELSELEYDSIRDTNMLINKNSSYENELHNIRFITIPKMSVRDYRGFFINNVSTEVYTKIKDSIVAIKVVKGGNRAVKKTRSKYNKKIFSSYNNRVNISGIKRAIKKTRKI